MAASWMDASGMAASGIAAIWMAASEMPVLMILNKSKLGCYSADFKQVKNFQNSLGETGCLGNFYFACWLPKRSVFLFIPTPNTAS